MDELLHPRPISDAARKQLRAFDLAFCSKVLPAVVQTAVYRAHDSKSFGLFEPVSELTTDQLKDKKHPCVHSVIRNVFNDISSNVSDQISKWKEWLGSAIHAEFEDADWVYSESPLDTSDPLTDFPRFCSNCEQINRIVTDPHVSFRRICELGRTVGAILSARLHADAEQLLGEAYLWDQVTSMLLSFSEQAQGGIQSLRPETGTSMDSMWSFIILLRREIAAGAQPNSALAIPTPTKRSRTKKGETPAWFFQAANHLHESSGKMSDAEIARRVGADPSALCRNTRYQKLRREFGRYSKTGEHIRDSAHSAQTSPQNLLHND